jgi:inward rectifier potassium channel
MARTDRTFSFHIVGQPRRPLSDLYHFLMRGSWARIILFASLSYVSAIAIFAMLFLLGGDCVDGVRPGSALDAFWFSVQTFSTIGYGGMLPRTGYAHLLVTVESFVGLAGVAVVTALMYSRFARPMARVGFSDQIAVSQRNGLPTLQLRIANERQNRIFDVRLRLHVLIEHTTAEGQTLQRLVELPLEMAETPVFIMSMVLIHRLDEDSPLHGLSPESVGEQVRFMMASFTGTDDALVQSVYAQKVYTTEDIVFYKRFRDMIDRTPHGSVMDYSRISDLEPEDETEHPSPTGASPDAAR